MTSDSKKSSKSEFDVDFDEFDDLDDIVVSKKPSTGKELKAAERDNRIKYLENYISNLPTFSPATKKIIELSQQLNAVPAEIVKAIRMDPVLTGKVLQMVNSAYFALADKVTSLNRAVVLLGINTIKNVALSTAMIQVVNAKTKEIQDLVDPLWRHSLAAAVSAKTLAKFTGIPKEMYEEFFIAGLLHDLGRIVLFQCFHDFSDQIKAYTLQDEKEAFGKNHAELAGEILSNWKFSENLIDGIANHHSPNGDSKFPYYIYLANEITYLLELNDEEEDAGIAIPVRSPIKEETWARIGVDPQNIRSVFKNVSQEIERAKIFLNIARE